MRNGVLQKLLERKIKTCFTFCKTLTCDAAVFFSFFVFFSITEEAMQILIVLLLYYLQYQRW